MGREADTIFAVASGAGISAVAVVRISGALAGPALDALAGGRPPARQATLRTLRAPGGDILDRGLVLWFPGPRSYSGEDGAELHVHGGAAVLEALAEALAGLGLRPAERGEFTRRAFLNGRMDLLQAEAVADLVQAETDAQRRQALRQLDGALGALYRGWSQRLLALLARQEALIDFPDDDLPPETEAAMLAEMSALRDAIAAHLVDSRRGERLRSGLVFAIAGAPNVGKSTLLNALVERDAAIVSATPGTTRDVIEARLILGGVMVTLLDTAGLRDTDDPVEAEGVRRARARTAAADALMLVSDGPAPTWQGDAPGHVLRIATKQDLGEGAAWADVSVSAVTGAGLPALRDRLAALAQTLAGTGATPALTRPRHRAALRDALAALDSGLAQGLPELRGEELRLAVQAIGRITGEVGVDDILDVVFREFCIGK